MLVHFLRGFLYWCDNKGIFFEELVGEAEARFLEDVGPGTAGPETTR
jgi:hypothetical protein